VVRFTDASEKQSVNARVSLIMSDEAWEVALWGRNLTNEDYIETVSDFSDSLGYLSGRRNEPRTYGVEAYYHF
jgi:iron complex outermembrane receptor protein